MKLIRLNQRETARFEKMVSKLFVVLGARPSGHTLYPFMIDTTAGPLQIAAEGDSVFMRFDDTDRAVRLLGSEPNPHSGKWNFHGFGHRKAEPVYQEFVQTLARVVNVGQFYDPKKLPQRVAA